MGSLGNILVPRRTRPRILDCVDEVFGVLLVRPRRLLHLILLLDGLEVCPLRDHQAWVCLVVDKELRKGVRASLFCPSFFGTPSACPKEACPLVLGMVQVHQVVCQRWVFEILDVGIDRCKELGIPKVEYPLQHLSLGLLVLAGRVD